MMERIFSKSETKKGISLLVLIITIVVILVISATVIITLMKQNTVGKAELASLKTDLKSMVDSFDIKYDKAVYKYRGDLSKIELTDLEGIVPEKYQTEFKVGLNGVEYIGRDTKIIEMAEELGIIIPSGEVVLAIKNLHVTATTSTIRVTVNLEQKIEGSIEYTIQYRNTKTSGATWKQAYHGANNMCEITGLDENNTFEVKAVATNTSNSQTAESDIIKITTKAFVEGDVILRANSITGELYTTDTWTKEDIYIQIKKSENATTTYEVTRGTEKIASAATQDMVLQTPGIYTIAVKTTDGTTTSNETYTAKIDKELPSGTLNVSEVTSNSITARIDTPSDALSGIREYAYYLDGVLKLITTDTSYTFKGLLQGSLHKVEVKVRDNAINETILVNDKVLLDTVAPGEGNINSLLNPSTWTNQNVTLTVTYLIHGQKGLVAQFSEDGQTFVDVSSPYTKIFATNTDVYARYRDSENQFGISKKISIWNIDKLPPSVTMTISENAIFEIPVGSTTKTVTSTLRGTDQKATPQYGESGFGTLQYAWGNSNTVEPTNWKNFTNDVAVSENIGGGNNYLWTKVIDRAGNRATSVKVSGAYNGRYRVEYHANGAMSGATPAYQQKLKDQTLVLRTTDLSRTGYRFNGWNTASNAGGTAYAAGGNYTANASTLLYASWLANTYSVVYNGNGNTAGSTATSNHTYGVARTLTGNGFSRNYTVTYHHNYTGQISASSKVVYSFAGWNTRADGAGTNYVNLQNVNNLTSVHGGVVNLYAKWTPNATTLTTPTRTGYTFGGWYRDAGCTNFVGNGGASFTPTANITLYAKWNIITYDIKYHGNGNGGGGLPNAQVKKYGETLTLRRTEPQREGYEFVCWNTKADGSGKDYDPEDDYTANAAATMYAQWSIETYAITYDANGGTGAPSKQNKVFDKNLKLRTGVPSRDNFKFTSWNTKRDNSGTKYNPGGTYRLNEAMKLYAQWENLVCPGHAFGASYNSASAEYPNYDNTKTYQEAYAIFGYPDKAFGFSWVCTNGHNHWMDGANKCSMRICVHCRIEAGLVGADRFWCPVDAGLGWQ